MPEKTAAVITVSDSCARKEREDLSGPAVARVLQDAGYVISAAQIVPDDKGLIEGSLYEAAKMAKLVVTTGGTGVSPRDVTPEATKTVCERLIEGIAEQMRAEGMKKTRFAALSRGVCGVRDDSLFLNLPGSPNGAVESLRAVLDLLPHVLDLISGKTEHKKDEIPAKAG